MSFVRLNKAFIVIIATLLAITATANAKEFPIGKIEGIGFEVTRGSMTITHDDLSIYESSAEIEPLGRDKIRITITAKMQRVAGTRIKNDRRVDTYEIEWTSDTGGKLINTSTASANDRSTFKIDGNELRIVSWIARNQLTETQIYRLK